MPRDNDIDLGPPPPGRKQMAVAALLRPPGRGDSHFLLLLLTLLSICSTVSCMRLDPERIAARLRIEQEIEMDHLAKVGRNRRQLAPQKEITIQVRLDLQGMFALTCHDLQ